MNASVDQFLSGKLTQVDVPKIENELNELWSSVNNSTPDSSHPSVARICMLSLVLYSQDQDAEITAGNLLDEVSVRHPCRAILAISRTSDNPKLEAWVSTRCHLTSDTKQICCEQITVRWEGLGIQELPSVVIPLLVPDLPVFLWWRTSCFDASAITPFANATDRLIVDSAIWNKLPESFTNLADKLKTLPTVSDLNWKRILGWRQLIAHAFDNGSNPGWQLIDTVTVTYEAGCGAQSLLLLGWLASRLQWQPTSMSGNGSFDSTYNFDGRMIKVKLLEQVSKDDIIRVEIKLSNGSNIAVSMIIQDGRSYLVAHVNGVEEKMVLINGLENSEASLLEQDLECIDHDFVYEQSVQMVAKTLKLRGK